VKQVVVVVWKGGKAKRQNGRLEGKAVRPHFLRGVQKKETESVCLDTEKRERSGRDKSNKPIEVAMLGIERIQVASPGRRRPTNGTKLNQMQ
jgi:hypothetical protein